MSRIIFTTTNFVGLLLFSVFAWLQHDDDNPAIYANVNLMDVWLWIAFYGLVALLFGLAIWRWFPWPLYFIAAFFCAYELSTTLPGLVANMASGHFTMTKVSMSPIHSEVELTREFFGALIALGGVYFLWWQRRKYR